MKYFLFFCKHFYDFKGIADKKEIDSFNFYNTTIIIVCIVVDIFCHIPNIYNLPNIYFGTLTISYFILSFLPSIAVETRHYNYSKKSFRLIWIAILELIFIGMIVYGIICRI